MHSNAQFHLSEVLSTFTFLVEYGKTFYLVTKVNKISVQPCTNKMCKEFYRFKTSDVMCKELHQQFNVNIVELCVCSFHWPYFECFIMVWNIFHRFGGGPAVNHLYGCAICQVEIETLAKRRKLEIDTFIKVNKLHQVTFKYRQISACLSIADYCCICCIVAHLKVYNEMLLVSSKVPTSISC